MEHDLHRLRYLLTESDANLSWVRQELEREEREAGLTLRQLQNETQGSTADLEKATKGEVSMVRQIEDIANRNHQEQARLGKELEAIRQAATAERSEAEARLSRARADIDLDVRVYDERNRGAINAGRLQEEALARENGQLKSFLAEQKSSSGGLSHLHNKLETHIQRLQRHTEDLRRDIHSSAASATAPAALSSVSFASRPLASTTELLQRSPPRHSTHSPSRLLSPTQDTQWPISPKLAGSSFAIGGSTRPGDMTALGTTF